MVKFIRDLINLREVFKKERQREAQEARIAEVISALRNGHPQLLSALRSVIR